VFEKEKSTTPLGAGPRRLCQEDRPERDRSGRGSARARLRHHAERKLTHPAVGAICEAARNEIFAE